MGERATRKKMLTVTQQGVGTTSEVEYADLEIRQISVLTVQKGCQLRLWQL
jgi:hypothetical protein